MVLYRIDACIQLYIHIYIYTQYVYIYIYIHTKYIIYIYTYTYHVYIYIYICICVHVFICEYIYILMQMDACFISYIVIYLCDSLPKQLQALVLTETNGIVRKHFYIYIYIHINTQIHTCKYLAECTFSYVYIYTILYIYYTHICPKHILYVEIIYIYIHIYVTVLAALHRRLIGQDLARPDFQWLYLANPLDKAKIIFNWL